MNYEIVKELPNGARRKFYRAPLKDLLEEFKAIDADHIKLDPIKEGYKSVRSMDCSIRAAIKKYGFRSTIELHTINGFLYLSKKEI